MTHIVGMGRDLLVISDLHLGEALRPGSPASHQSRDREQAIVDFLDHYRDRGNWKLVINGDMVDFLSMTFPPGADESVESLHPDDHIYGVAQRAGSAAQQLRAALAVHPRFVSALARFITAGHPVAIIVGNHDAAFHFEAVREVLREALVSAWQPHPWAILSASEIGEAVSFHDWFLLERGFAWIEHGHQYDPYCSFEHQLDPLAHDRDELDPTVSGVAMRYFANHFIPEGESAETWSFGGYLSFAASSGRISEVFFAYVAMCRRLIDRALVARKARRHRRRRHFQRLAMLARLARQEEWKLRVVDAQRRHPATSSLGELFSALMLDRLLLLFGTVAWCLVCLAMPVNPLPAMLLCVGGACLAHAVHSHLEDSREDTQPQQRMREVARLIRRMVATPVVVMGHAHEACVTRERDGIYVNTGTWVQGDVQSPHALRAFTHLVLRRTPKGPRGGLFRWVHGRSVRLEGVGG